MHQGKEHQGPTRSQNVPRGLPLPEPNLVSRTSLEEALRLRQTVRDISGKKLDTQLLSDLLFAACGVNRRSGPFGGPGLTAASASNSHEVDVYVALEEGVYVFEPRSHGLTPVVAEDVRGLALGPNEQKVERHAPIQLIFVVDLEKLDRTSGFEEPGLHDPEIQKSYYFVDTGLIAANVYLFAASRGLACWFHNCDRAGLTAKLGLKKRQRVLFAQSVGYPIRETRT
jgi:nitroreductase family protein